jgi:hypothetical protein
LVLEVAMLPACDVYKVSESTMGMKTVLRKAPAWLLSLHGKHTFQIQVGEDNWTVEVGGRRKTYASARPGKRRFYIDTTRKPAPGFRKQGMNKYVPIEVLQQVLAATNAALPTWKQQLGADELNSSQMRSEFKNTKLIIEADAPLRILWSKRPSPLGDFLKTKLSSAPTWLLQGSQGRVRVPIELDGETWMVKVKTDIKTHIKPDAKLIIVNANNVPGRTRGIEPALLIRLCDAFNAQCTAESNVRFSEQRRAFKAATFSCCNDESELACVSWQKQCLMVQVTKAPKWLTECRETFYVPVGQDVWECCWKDEPSMDGKAQTLALGKSTIKANGCTQSMLEAVLTEVNAALPSWREVMQERSSGEQRLRREEFAKFGPIKRQHVALQSALDALRAASQ